MNQAELCSLIVLICNAVQDQNSSTSINVMGTQQCPCSNKPNILSGT